ncbi:MAG: hypothetical protein QF790_05055 [Gammaproteobacteria bacterium]|jgi:hypothetical protein|nr:hypothetical protein [Gammaproteobacteria bacterium]MDP6616516.1 hypothetical protein [Gammaproteobacteria bacterium]MDP6694235.1 hypothetical protein [Gammaproteobacteria bacterium]
MSACKLSKPLAIILCAALTCPIAAVAGSHSQEVIIVSEQLEENRRLVVAENMNLEPD